MLELIISFLMSMGYQAQSGTHFIMNKQIAHEITATEGYYNQGGDRELLNYVSIEDVDDVIIIDDTTPKEVK
jgi:hypothetical protein